MNALFCFKVASISGIAVFEKMKVGYFSPIEFGDLKPDVLCVERGERVSSREQTERFYTNSVLKEVIVKKKAAGEDDFGLCR